MATNNELLELLAKMVIDIEKIKDSVNAATAPVPVSPMCNKPARRPRQAPEAHAGGKTPLDIGTLGVGANDLLYIVALDKNGRHFWKKTSEAPTPGVTYAR